MISRIPEDDICVVLLSNASDPTLQEMTQSIFAVLYNKPYELPKERIAVELPEVKLKAYAGEYEIQPGMRVILSIKDGKLTAEPEGQPRSILYAEKEDHFFIKSPDMQLQFTRNEKNEISGFILRQGSREMHCKKTK